MRAEDDELCIRLEKYVEETHRRYEEDSEIRDILETLTNEDPLTTEYPVPKAVHEYLSDVFFYLNPISRDCLKPDEKSCTDDDDHIPF